MTRGVVRLTVLATLGFVALSTIGESVAHARRGYRGHGYRGHGRYHHLPAYGGPYLSLGVGWDWGWGWGGYGYPWGGCTTVVRQVTTTPVRTVRAAMNGVIETAVWPGTATVYLDGSPMGPARDFTARAGGLEVTPGAHTLSFVAPGYQTATARVTVLADRSHSVRMRLREEPASGGSAEAPLQGERAWPPRGEAPPAPPDARGAEPLASADLRLHVEPPGSSVYVDGTFEGVTGSGPLVVGGLPPGIHQVEVFQAGHLAFRGDVVIYERGAAVDLTVTLEPQAPEPDYL